MIISHKYKFIFIKSFKTAGTSLEIALSKFCDKEDVITPLISEDENIRKKLNYRGPQNYQGMTEHMSAQEIKQKINPEIFHNYLKFVTVRDPFDQIISAYYWHNESKKKERKLFFFKKREKSFAEFFKIKAKNIYKDEYNRYTDNNVVIVDKFLKYENLKEDIANLSKRLKLPENLYNALSGIKAKSSARPRNTRTLELDEDYKKKIRELAKDIILLHNY